MSSIVVSASTGPLNLGDEAMLSENLRVLREAGLSVVTVLSDNPPKTRAFHGVDAIPSFYQAFHLRYGSPWRRRNRVLLPIYLARLVWNASRLRRGNPVARLGSTERFVLETIASADAFLTVGGGGFNDLWPFWGVYARGAEILVAKCLGKPVFIGAQGVGPVHRRTSRFILSHVFRGTYLTLRDFGVSQREVIGRLRISGARVVEALDDAFDLAPRRTSACRSLLRSEGLDGFHREKRVAAVCVRGWWKRRHQGSHLQMAFSEILRSLVDEGFFVLVLPMSLSEGEVFNDTDSSQTILRLTGLIGHPKVRVVRGISSGSDVKGMLGLVHAAVGSSYHFSLFALTMGTPAVGLYQDDYYRMKFEGLNRLFGNSAPFYDVRQTPTANIVSHLIGLASGPRAALVPDASRPIGALLAARAVAASLSRKAPCHQA